MADSERKALTLIEVLIALAIIVIITLGLTALQLNQIGSSSYVKKREQALIKAESLLRFMEANGGPCIASGEVVCNETADYSCCGDLIYDSSVINGSFAVSFRVENATDCDNCTKVTVTVTFEERGNSRRVSISRVFGDWRE